MTTTCGNDELHSASPPFADTEEDTVLKLHRAHYLSRSHPSDKRPPVRMDPDPRLQSWLRFRVDRA